MLTYEQSSKEKIIKSIQSNNALLIDFDGTLMDYKLNEKKALEKLFININLPNYLHSQAIKDYTTFNESYWKLFDSKKITIEEARHGGWEDFITKYELNSTSKNLNSRFLEFLVQTTSIDSKVIKVLKNLKFLGTHIIIITNGVQVTQSRRLENSGILSIIDTFFTSESVGFAKPHPKMFLDSKKFLESINCPTNDIWVVGDSFESDIKGAFHVGYNTCWITNEKNREVLDSEGSFPTAIANNFIEFAEFYQQIKSKSEKLF